MNTTYTRICQQTSFRVPDHWHTLQTIDMHTGGEPLRVVVSGFPELQGTTILEYRNEVKNRFDHLRKALMWEPRGHADMYGCLLTPPERSDSELGILFMHNEGYSTMCGHAVIAIGKLALEMGWVEKQEPETEFRVDAPCGQITIWVSVENGKVGNVRFWGVPSFVVGLDRQVLTPNWGEVQYDLAYGGAFYAYVNSDALGLELIPENYARLIQCGREIKQAVILQDTDIVHPDESDLSFLYGTIFMGGPISEGVDSRNVCVFADGEVDRCPTGSGVSGRMPIHYKRGVLKVGEKMTIESIVGSVFEGSIVEVVRYGVHEAVIPQVIGTAHITGQHQFLIDPDDPFAQGFFLR